MEAVRPPWRTFGDKQRRCHVLLDRTKSFSFYQVYDVIKAGRPFFRLIVWTGLLLQIWQPVSATMLSDVIKMEEYVPRRHSGPAGTVPYNGTYLYLPAPPGKSPRCARGGLTYCAEIPSYPSDVIRRLLTQWKYDLSTVFVSESTETLNSVPPQTSSRTRGRSSQRYRTFFGQSRAATDRRQPISSRDRSAVTNQKSVRFGFDQSISGLFTTRKDRGGQIGYSFNSRRRPKRQADDASAGTQLCPTTGQFVTPKAGLNNRGEWRFVINMDGDDEAAQQYTQLVRAERCLSDRCTGLCTVPAGMEASCQQQYVQKKMVGLDPSGSQMYTDLYWLPHCCVCQIR